jgi:cystathionine beta-lyase family protein involved in aluminum resistance
VHLLTFNSYTPLLDCAVPWQRAVAFCTVVQQCSPVNAHYRPEPGATPGYGDEVMPLCITHASASAATVAAVSEPLLLQC